MKIEEKDVLDDVKPEAGVSKGLTLTLDAHTDLQSNKSMADDWMGFPPELLCQVFWLLPVRWFNDGDGLSFELNPTWIARKKIGKDERQRP